MHEYKWKSNEWNKSHNKWMDFLFCFSLSLGWFVQWIQIEILRLHSATTSNNKKSNNNNRIFNDQTFPFCLFSVTNKWDKNVDYYVLVMPFCLVCFYSICSNFFFSLACFSIRVCRCHSRFHCIQLQCTSNACAMDWMGWHWQ